MCQGQSGGLPQGRAHLLLSPRAALQLHLTGKSARTGPYSKSIFNAGRELTRVVGRSALHPAFLGLLHITLSTQSLFFGKRVMQGLIKMAVTSRRRALLGCKFQSLLYCVQLQLQSILSWFTKAEMQGWFVLGQGGKYREGEERLPGGPCGTDGILRAGNRWAQTKKVVLLGEKDREQSWKETAPVPKRTPCMEAGKKEAEFPASGAAGLRTQLGL